MLSYSAFLLLVLVRLLHLDIGSVRRSDNEASAGVVVDICRFIPDCVSDVGTSFGSCLNLSMTISTAPSMLVPSGCGLTFDIVI